MPHRLKRASIARLIVGMAVLAFPLLATGVAQASIAGAAPASTVSTGPPDVVSATVLDSDQVNVCFDKTIALNSSSFHGFALDGYRSANSLQSTIANVNSTNTNCAIVLFPSATVGQIDKFTVVMIAEGAVQSNSTGARSAVADSVALTPASGSTDLSHDGTRGVTTAPNLVSIAAPSAVQSPPVGNQLTYTFDRNVTDVVAGDFFMVQPNGDVCRGFSDSVSGATVSVNFFGNLTVPGSFCLEPPTPLGLDSVTGAFQGGVFIDGVTSAQDVDSFNFAESTYVTGMTSTVSQRPVLINATLNPANLDQVTYTYDRPIQIGALPLYGVGLSNATTGIGVWPINAVQTSPTQIAVSFSGTLSNQAEYAVDAWSPYCAVFPLGDPAACSVPGSQPIGGNAGAFSGGFTTGADVMGVNISGSGVVTVVVDQRLNTNPFPLGIETLIPAIAGGVSLLDANGQPIVPSLPPGAALLATTPGTYTFTLTYTPLEVVGAKMVAFGTNDMATPLTTDAGELPTGGLGFPFLQSVDADWFSVPQVVSSTATAGQLKAIKVAKKTTKKTKKA